MIEPIQQLLTTADVVVMTGLSPRTLANWRYLGKIPYVRVGGCVRYRRAEIERWLDAGCPPAPLSPPPQRNVRRRHAPAQSRAQAPG